jgi:hypothetical protein
MKILKPFGPPILKITIDQQMINALNTQCDHIVANEDLRNKNNCSESLSKAVKGKIEEELHCNLYDKNLEKFRQFLFEGLFFLHNNNLKDDFMMDLPKIPKEEFQIHVHNSWYVRSFENDFNPLHRHTNGTPDDTSLFSCVGYLKVPKTIEKSINSKAGCIDFMFGVSSHMSIGNFVVRPRVGDFYIFPGYLGHLVYPFQGREERRSFSANITASRIITS